MCRHSRTAGYLRLRSPGIRAPVMITIDPRFDPGLAALLAEHDITPDLLEILG